MAKNTNDEIGYDHFLKYNSEEKVLLRLYITGATVKSMKAIENIKIICEKYLKGRYTLEVIDVYRQPRLAIDDQIVAIPTLINITGSKVRLIGDMSDKKKILAILGLNVNLNGEADH
jgi:circadian clock protein KaiB